MDKKSNQKIKKQKNRNKEAIEFILANREENDPNIEDENSNKKILLQINKDEDLTEEQKKIIDSIPKEQRGIYDKEEKIKKLLNINDKKEENETKGVKFNFGKNEIIPFNTKDKILDLKKNKNEEIDTLKKINIPEIEDDSKYLDELFKRIKVKAKIVEYNEYGLPKNIDPEILEYVTNKEFKEGVDIFIPAPKNNIKEMRRFDTDIKEENMDEEYKELEAELMSSDDENYNNENNKNKENMIIEDNNNKDGIKIIEEGNLEDNFILLANEGELPIEFLSEKEIKEKEELENKKYSDKENHNSYKFITKEEEKYIMEKLEEEDKKLHEKKEGYISKSEFNEAINEILNTKKGKELNKNNTIMGLKKSYKEEGDYEEYEINDDEDIPEEIREQIKKVELLEKENKKNNNINLNNEEEEYEEIEEEEEDENNYKPNIKIEYVNKEDEPDPFEKEKKIRKKEKNKKNGKKSRTKQYQLDKKNGELSDESFTKEDLDQITQDKKNIEKTIELLVNKNDEEDDEKVINEDIEKNYIYEPQNQKRKNINQIEGKINYLPKEVKEVRREKIKKNKNEKKINEDNNNNDINDKKNNNEDIKDDFNGKDDEKKKNKLRKQALKAERREKRKEKKELKQAFKNEKKIQQHQIAEANKTVRYGLSIKDL